MWKLRKERTHPRALDNKRRDRYSDGFAAKSSVHLLLVFYHSALRFELPLKLPPPHDGIAVSFHQSGRQAADGSDRLCGSYSDLG